MVERVHQGFKLRRDLIDFVESLVASRQARNKTQVIEDALFFYKEHHIESNLNDRVKRLEGLVNAILEKVSLQYDPAGPQE